MSTIPDVEGEMRRLASEAQKQGILLRLIGGLAVKVHCPSINHLALTREYPDIDFVADRPSARRLADFWLKMGYVPNKSLNTLNGDRRQLYYDEERGRQVDIFVGAFEMCHRLDLSERLHVEPLTIPLAELFLSKAQIVEMNRKDVLDLLAILLDHEVGPRDEETINTDVVAGLCAKDWGLYTTASLNAQRLWDILAQGSLELEPDHRETIRTRLATIRAAMEAAPKTLAWKARAKVGTRVRWYEEVEEVQR